MIVSRFVMAALSDQSCSGLILRYRKDSDYEEFYF